MIVWQHRDGWIATWLLQGTAVTTGLLFSTNHVADPAWRIVAAGTIDSISSPALVWQHDSNTLAVWYVNGPTVLNGIYLNPNSIADTNWRIVGAR